jgi:undecaprenyl-diphosphatase
LERGFLVGLGLAAGAFWAFIEIADEVLEGGTRGIDRALLLAFRSADDPSDPWGPRWFKEVMRDLTALGGMAVGAGWALLCWTVTRRLQRRGQIERA